METSGIPTDLTLKAAIQSAALNTFFNLNFKRSVSNNPAFKFMFDLLAEGHTYYKFCLDACHVQSPVSVDLCKLIAKYKEPSIVVPMLRDESLIEFEKNINGIVSSAKTSIARLVEAQASIEAFVACVKAVVSFKLPLFTNDLNIPKLFRRKIEQEYTFSSRLIFAIITFILMSSSSDWFGLFKPYFCWILRLADVAATSQHHHTLILTLLSLFRMENLVDEATHVDILTLIEADELPGVSQVFNDHQGLPGIRKKYIVSKFDQTPPSVDNSAVEKLLKEPKTVSALYIDPDYTSGGILAHILMNIKHTATASAESAIPYQPIDYKMIAQEGFPIDLSSIQLTKRLNDFLENIDYELKALNLSSMKRLSNQKTIEQSKVSKRRVQAYRDFGGEMYSRKEGEWEKTVSWAQEEMGIAEDGTVLGATSGEQRLGLGAGSKSTNSAEELYEDYRRQRAHKYHKSIAQAHSERQTNSELGIDASRICCICQQPGHFARECKFGLT